MASNDQSGIASSPTSSSSSGEIPIFVLSYNAQNWSNGITLLDNSEPRNANWGTLAVVSTLLDAQDLGIDWIRKQLQDRLDKNNPPLETEKDRDAALQDWSKTVSKKHKIWSYMIGKGNEILILGIETYCLYGPLTALSMTAESEEEEESYTANPSGP